VACEADVCAASDCTPAQKEFAQEMIILATDQKLCAHRASMTSYQELSATEFVVEVALQTKKQPSATKD
jgi:hypothetical protein